MGTVKGSESQTPLSFGERQRRTAGFRGRVGRRGRAAFAVHRGPREPERLAGRAQADTEQRAEDGDQLVSSLSGIAKVSPRISETFFWSAMMASACLSLRFNFA